MYSKYIYTRTDIINSILCVCEYKIIFEGSHVFITRIPGPFLIITEYISFVRIWAVFGPTVWVTEACRSNLQMIIQSIIIIVILTHDIIISSNSCYDVNIIVCAAISCYSDEKAKKSPRTCEKK